MGLWFCVPVLSVPCCASRMTCLCSQATIQRPDCPHSCRNELSTRSFIRGSPATMQLAASQRCFRQSQAAPVINRVAQPLPACRGGSICQPEQNTLENWCSALPAWLVHPCQGVHPVVQAAGPLTASHAAATAAVLPQMCAADVCMLFVRTQGMRAGACGHRQSLHSSPQP